MRAKDIIKAKIKRYPLFFTILKIINNRTDTEYMKKIYEVTTPSYKSIFLRYNEKASMDVAVGEIDGVSNLEGFFAAMRWILGGIYFCDKSGFLPVVKIPEDWMYYDKTMPADKNPFEYFFEQPANISAKQIDECSIVYECNIQHCQMVEKLNGTGGATYLYTDTYVSQMSNIVEKYLKFNSNTQEILTKNLEEKGINSKILGVHVRGTDYKQNCNEHPMFIEPREYFEYIDKALESTFEKIYLATDDTEIVQLFLEKYGTEKLIYDKNISRATGDVGVHIQEKDSANGYKMGLDVLTDMYTLANCGGLISGLSQVSLFARIFNKSFDSQYVYDKIVSKAINKNTKEFRM